MTDRHNRKAENTDQDPVLEPLGASSGRAHDAEARDAEAREAEEAPPEPPSDERLDEWVRAEELRQEPASLRQLKDIIGKFVGPRFVFLGDTHITGDMVARDQYRGSVATGSAGAEAPFAAEHVLAEELAKVRAVYVPPPAYERAREVLTRQHLLILRGRPRIGKWTTALYLGTETLRAENVIELDPALDLRDLATEEALEPETCYVTETLAPDSAEALTGFRLNRLRKALRRQRSYLILCATAEVPVAGEAREHCVVDWDRSPPAEQALERHLHFYLSSEAAARRGAQELVRSEEVQALLDRHLLPGELDRLAELLARVAREEAPLEEALARFEARVERQVERWFENHEDPDLLAFMVTLAVFSGARYQDVAEAHRQLLELAAPRQETDDDARPASAFASRRRPRVKQCHAHLETTYEDREYGRTQVEIVAFDNPAFQPAVLAYAWDEFDILRRPLLTWLSSFGQAAFARRARAAAAAGELGKHDFVTVLEALIRPWANGRDFRTRDAAALALGILAWHPDRTADVRGLLKHWATLENNPRLRWTAASAYGSLAGLRFPEMALRNLFRMIADGDARLFGVVSRSIAFLFEAGDSAPEFFHKVLDALKGWTEHKRRLPRLVSLLIFLELAGLRMPDERRDEAADPWPRLLHLAHDDEALRSVSTTILRRALSEKVTRRPALNRVYGWLQQAEEDETLVPAIGGLLRPIVTEGRERDRRRLRYYLDGWANDPASPLAAAGQVLHQITSESSA